MGRMFSRCCIYCHERCPETIEGLRSFRRYSACKDCFDEIGHNFTPDQLEKLFGVEGVNVPEGFFKIELEEVTRLEDRTKNGTD